MKISQQRRHEIIDALRRGTVPRSSLDALATGLERFRSRWTRNSHSVKAGGSVFKAVRGDYGCGKTFFARWLAERAKKIGLCGIRGPGVGDRDAVAPPGDGLPAFDGAPGNGRHAPGRPATGAGQLVLRLGAGRAGRGDDRCQRQRPAPGTHQRAAGAAAGQGDGEGPHVQRRPAWLPSGPGRQRCGDGGWDRGLAGRSAQRRGGVPSGPPA